MIKDLNKILVEWSYRTSDGKPDVKNSAKLIVLESVLNDFGWSREARAELLNNLINEVKPTSFVGMTKAGKKRYFQDKDSLQRAIKRGSVTPVDKKDDKDKDAGKPKPSMDFDRFADKPKAGDDSEDETQSQDEDTFSPVPDKLINNKMKNINAQLDNAPENPPHLTKEIKQKISTLIEKTFKGEDLNSEEEELALSHLKFVTTEGVPDSPKPTARTDIYLALENPKEFYPASKRTSLFPPVGSRSKTTTPAFKKWVDNLESKYDVFVGTTSEGAVGKKVLVPNKLTSERKIAKIEKQDDGSIKFNGKPMKKIGQPDEDVLLKAVRKNNPNMTDEEVKGRATIIGRQIARYNDQINDLSEAGDFEYVDYGPVQSSDDRKKTSQSIISTTENKFKDLLTKAGAMDKPENKKVFDTINKLKEDRDPENNEKDREEYNEILNQLLVDMASSVDFKDSVADYAEIKVALEKLSQGNPVYAPASETFKISDIVIINPIDTSDLGLDDADKLSESLKYLNVALEFVGGESVKYKGGGAGMSDDKVRLTVYKGKETRKRLNDLLAGYYSLYPEDRDPPNYPPSDENIKESRDKFDDTKNWAMENDIVSEEEANAIESYAERRGDLLHEKFMKNGVGNCMDDKEKERYKESIKQYLREMKMMEALNNNDLEYTKFGNSNQKIGLKDGKPGRAYSEEIDGIKKPCYMKFKDDPGFSFSPTSKGCVTATPTNRNPSEIHAEKPKIKS